MKRIIIFSLFNILWLPVIASAQQCCPDGYYEEMQSAMLSGGWCYWTGQYTCNRQQCTPCPSEAEFNQCIGNGDTWDPGSCTCSQNCSDNSQRAQACRNERRVWDSFTCTCGDCDPYYENSCIYYGAWDPETCTCGSPDPCDEAYAVPAYVVYEECTVWGSCYYCNEVCGNYTCVRYWQYIGLWGANCGVYPDFGSSGYGCFSPVYECNYLCYC
jgi:hypothetical protein